MAKKDYNYSIIFDNLDLLKLKEEYKKIDTTLKSAGELRYPIQELQEIVMAQQNLIYRTITTT